MEKPFLSQCFHEVGADENRAEPRESNSSARGWAQMPWEWGCPIISYLNCVSAISSWAAQFRSLHRFFFFFSSPSAVLFATVPPWCALQPCHFPKSYSWKRISKITQCCCYLTFRKWSTHTQVTNHAHQMANVALFTSKWAANIQIHHWYNI